MECSSVRQKILCFDGDSRTKLPVWPAFSPDTLNYVRGVSGTNTTQCVARLAGYGYLYPAAAIIEAGINDAPTGLSTTIANIETIVEWYAARSQRVYVCSTYPTNIALFIATYPTNPNATVAKLTALNTFANNVSDAIQSWCIGKAGVTFIDLRPVSSPSGELLVDYTIDGIHGSDLMNQLIIDSVDVYENNYPAGL